MPAKYQGYPRYTLLPLFCWNKLIEVVTTRSGFQVAESHAHTVCCLASILFYYPLLQLSSLSYSSPRVKVRSLIASLFLFYLSKCSIFNSASSTDQIVSTCLIFNLSQYRQLIITICSPSVSLLYINIFIRTYSVLSNFFLPNTFDEHEPCTRNTNKSGDYLNK